MILIFKDFNFCLLTLLPLPRPLPLVDPGGLPTGFGGNFLGKLNRNAPLRLRLARPDTGNLAGLLTGVVGCGFSTTSSGSLLLSSSELASEL